MPGTVAPGARILCALLLIVLADGQIENEKIDEIIRRWAPKIWLSPGEIFFPLSVEEFLLNVYPGNEDGEKYPNELPIGSVSEKLFLFTKNGLEDLKNRSSYLYGKSPAEHSVPIYVTVSNCDSSKKRTFNFNYKKKEETERNEILEPDLHFHVSYWIFYPYNKGKEICYLGNIPTPFIFNTCIGQKRFFGNHVGDFEHLSLSFKGKPYPDELYLAVHDAGGYYTYDNTKRIFKYKSQVSRGLVQKPKFPPTVRLAKGRPVLFAADGSHGLWPAPGEHDFVSMPKLSDQTGYGTLWKTWLNLDIIHLGYSRPPAWLKFRGKWGNPKSNCFLSPRLGVCEFSDGPTGILRKKQDFYCV